MIVTRRSALALLALAGAAGAAQPGDKPELAKFTCEFRKKDDTFEVAGTPGREVFRIRSATGIGSATITRRAGMWPETVTIRFVGMRYLESFSATVGKVQLGGSERAAKEPIYFDKDGKALPTAEGSAFSLKIEKIKDEGMEVRIGLSPAARMGTELKLDWIDAFRR
jgi:hypothetical protein